MLKDQHTLTKQNNAPKLVKWRWKIMKIRIVYIARWRACIGSNLTHGGNVNMWIHSYIFIIFFLSLFIFLASWRNIKYMKHIWLIIMLGVKNMAQLLHYFEAQLLPFFEVHPLRLKSIEAQLLRAPAASVHNSHEPLF